VGILRNGHTGSVVLEREWDVELIHGKGSNESRTLITA